MTFNFPTAPKNPPQGYEKNYMTQLVNVINNIMQGKMNITGDVTLTASAATTTVTDPRVSPNTAVDLMPTTANAATAKASAWIVVGEGSFVIHHANNAQTDKTFRYTLLG